MNKIITIYRVLTACISFRVLIAVVANGRFIRPDCVNKKSVDVTRMIIYCIPPPRHTMQFPDFMRTLKPTPCSNISQNCDIWKGVQAIHGLTETKHSTSRCHVMTPPSVEDNQAPPPRIKNINTPMLLFA